LGLSFVDPNSFIEDGDFARDGQHLNGREKDNYTPELLDFMSEDRQGVRSNKYWKSQNEGYQVNAAIIDRKSEDFT